MLNTLGIALAQADRPATKSTLFIEGVKLYTKINADLESQRPGKKRWGIEWQDADLVTRKTKDRQDQQKKVDDAWNALQPAQASLQAGQNDLASSQWANSKNQRDALAQAANNKINAAQNAVDRAQKALDAANNGLAAIPGPVWPPAVSLDDLDLSMSQGVVLASASSTGTIQDKARPSTPHSAVDPKPGSTPIQTPAVVDKHKMADPAPANPPAVNPAPAASPHVTRYAVAFAIAPDILVTAASTVEGASDIEITNFEGKVFHAEVIRALHGEGIALLKADGADFPTLNIAGTPAGGSLTCMGFPEVELFNPVAKQMTATSNDQTDTWTVSLGTSPRLPGGPLMKAGSVVGVELGDRDSELGKVPAAPLKSLRGLIADAAHPGSQPRDPKLAVVMVMAIR